MAAPVNITEGLGRAVQQILDDCTHLAVGTGTTPPQAGDSQLGEETNRVAIGQKLRTGATIQLRATFANANMPTTFEEVGLFMNGSSSPNSGDILVRALENFTKASADLLLVFEITLT